MLDTCGPLATPGVSKRSTKIASMCHWAGYSTSSSLAATLAAGAIGTDPMVNYMKRVAGESGRACEEVEAGIVAPLPHEAFSRPANVAHMTLFLACDDARTVTGPSINVDAWLVMS